MAKRMLAGCLVAAGLLGPARPAEGAERRPGRPGGAALSKLRVSGNGRFLVRADGSPFFWLGDTAWPLFQRARLEDGPEQPGARLYFERRAAQGFNVVQACLICWDVEAPNAYGHRALEDRDFTRPLIRPGPANDYWDTADRFVALAAAHGIYLALLPVWANGVANENALVQDPGVAYRYGHFLGSRYRSQPHVIWVLGGDAVPKNDVDNPQRLAAARAMAEGLADGTNGIARHDGKADYSTTLMTYHPRGGGQSSSRLLHAEEWLDFNMIQTTTRFAFANYATVADDYAKTPPKPALDAEVAYENSFSLRREFPGRRIQPWHVRKAAYWSVFAGGFGYTYGHRSMVLWSREGEKLLRGADVAWNKVLDAEGAGQMAHLRRLMESRPFLSRVPDQSLIAAGEGEGAAHARATRDDEGRYALVYLPTGNPVTIRMDKLRGKAVKARWFDPRHGDALPAGEMPPRGEREFVPPPRHQDSTGDAEREDGQDNDWVLLLESVR